jgi:hypothetical protein
MSVLPEGRPLVGRPAEAMAENARSAVRRIGFMI